MRGLAGLINRGAYTRLMFVCYSAFGVEDDNDILNCSWSQFGAFEGG